MKRQAAEKWDIGIIGGGAAGLMAAIAAKNAAPHCRVAVFERKERVGKKLLATGNGRCNFTNIYAQKENYYGGNRDFVVPALACFGPFEAMDFFRSLGIEPWVEAATGRVYPYSLQASSFLDMLRLGLEQGGVSVLTEAEILGIKNQKGAWLLQGKDRTFLCQAVIFAQGGQAAPQLSGTQSGYALAKTLGHEVTAIYPSLVQVKTENAFPKALQGIKIQGKAGLWQEGRCCREERGEILFTAYGLSGPPILQLSTFLAGGIRKAAEIRLDFCPDFGEEELAALLKERQKCLSPATLDYFLTGFLQKKAGQLLLKSLLSAKLSTSVQHLTPGEIGVLAHGLKTYPLPITGVTGWEHAQVTAGGVCTDAVEAVTMESKIARGCYFCGEVLDIHGDCGGYNLQWAWSSGHLAGESSAKQVCHAEN